MLREAQTTSRRTYRKNCVTFPSYFLLTFEDPTLQEVGHQRAGRDHVRFVRDRIEDLELLVVILVHLQNRCLISAAITVVRGRPDRDERLVKEELEALVHELMRATHELKTIHSTKLLSDLGAEEPASATLRNLPSVNVGLRIRPDEVTESALMRRLLVTIDETKLIQRGNLR